MSKFKVGDRARLIGIFDTTAGLVKNRLKVGALGTICKITYLTEYPYWIQFDDLETSVGIEIIAIDKARIRNTKIARKVYPNYTEDGEWLLVN